MKVLSWEQKRARILSALTPLDPGAETRARRLYEAVEQQKEARLLNQAQQAITEATDVAPDFCEDMPENLLQPYSPPDSYDPPTSSFTEGELPDSVLPEDEPKPPSRQRRAAQPIDDELPPQEITDF